MIVSIWTQTHISGRGQLKSCVFYRSEVCSAAGPSRVHATRLEPFWPCRSIVGQLQGWDEVIGDISELSDIKMTPTVASEELLPHLCGPGGNRQHQEGSLELIICPWSTEQPIRWEVPPIWLWQMRGLETAGHDIIMNDTFIRWLIQAVLVCLTLSPLLLQTWWFCCLCSDPFTRFWSGIYSLYSIYIYRVVIITTDDVILRVLNRVDLLLFCLYHSERLSNLRSEK